MPDTLDDFERSPFTLEGATRTVYRLGSGPAVIVISELPGITPNVARFARMVAGIGCTAVMPHLFGDDGRDPTMPYAAKGLLQACVSKEFATWALDRTSPITVWLRALARAEHERCGGPGVGAVGMCLTGGFALAMMVDDVVVACGVPNRVASTRVYRCASAAQSCNSHNAAAKVSETLAPATVPDMAAVLVARIETAAR